MAAGVVDPYPWFLHKHVEIDVNGRPMQIRIQVPEWTDYWRLLLEYLHNKHLEHPKRLIIGVGGPGGSGKAFFAEQINWIIGKGMLPGCYALTLPMDGFFYDQLYLRRQYRITQDGFKIPLSDVKGAPDTFNIEKFKQHLQTLRGDFEQDLIWPGYSYDYGDVVPRMFRIHNTFNIIIVFGDFTLFDRGAYHGLPDLFDVRIYVESPAAVIISHLMQRHMRNGLNEVQAKECVKKIDLPIARTAETTRGTADLIVERNTDERLSSLKWKNPADMPILDTPILPRDRQDQEDPGVF